MKQLIIERNYMNTIRFEDLELKPQLLRGLKHMGFENASPIQAQAIPLALSGKDLVGQAQTGTGKTAAFGIPVLETVDPELKKVQALILCPTRELAIQVSDELRKIAKFMHGIKILPIYGGQDINRQIRALKGVQIVVGTPGRIMDHMRRHTLKFDDLKMIALDEADEMLNMGFREDIETILEKMPEERQTLLFSATMPKPIMDITRNYQKDAQVIKIVKKELTVKNIEQYYFEVRKKDKKDVLVRLVDVYDPKLAVVFCNTKRMTDEVAAHLKENGYHAEALHGDLSQGQRDRVMNGFRSGAVTILVATDVAARGIDVDDVDLVFNYDLPQDNEYYVHRIGRTGRAGRQGVALSFVSGKDFYRLRDISRYAKTKIKLKRVPSATNVMESKAKKLFAKMEHSINEEDLTKYMVMIEEMADAKDYTAMQVAAALLKEIIGDNQPKKEEHKVNAENTGAKEKGMARLFLNIGKRQRVRPGDILGAIAGETEISGDQVGTIDMFDKFSFVEVPAHIAGDVLKAMEQVKIKGKKIRIELANDKR
jgi:ATP-dependent RNA helicase DeaD